MLIFSAQRLKGKGTKKDPGNLKRVASDLLELAESVDQKMDDGEDNGRIVDDVDQWLLLIGPGEGGAIEDINKTLKKRGPEAAEFRQLSEHGWGGLHYPMREVYGMAIAPTDPKIILDALKAADWCEPDMCAVVYSLDDAPWQFFQVEQLLGDIED
jgi:hypothetical protein